jgi:hypothetical protein
MDRITNDVPVNDVPYSSTVLVAGHDTTASALTWLLYELSKHPGDQQRIRDEIKTARANAEARGDEDLLTSDFNNMNFTNAVIKVCPPLVLDIFFSSSFVSQEGLRLHPIVPLLVREADSDDVIPLSHPIETRSGKIINEIPISKGQGITASICAYNRLVSSIIELFVPSLKSYFSGSKVCGEKMRTSGTQTVSWTKGGKRALWGFSPICV